MMGRKTIEHCQECGGDIRRGRSHSGGRQYTCLICQVAYALAQENARPRVYARNPRTVECACGCGRIGPLAGRGLVEICYRRWWRAQHRAAMEAR